MLNRLSYRIFGSVLFLLLVYFPKSGWAQRQNCNPDQRMYGQLNDPLFFYVPNPNDDSDFERYKEVRLAGTARLNRFITKRIQQKLNAGSDSAELTSYLSCLQEGQTAKSTAEKPRYFSFHKSDPYATNTPVVVASGAPDILITALVINRGGNVLPDTSPMLQCFAKSGRDWLLVGETGKEYEGHTFFVYPLKSPLKDQTWLLLAGRPFGNTGSVLTLEVVSCDRHSFKVNWKRGNIYGGQVSVENEGSTVTLSHLKRSADGFYPGIHGDAPMVTEVLRVTPQGLK